MAFAERLAGQLRQPSGIPGRALAYVLNRGNRPINAGAVARLDAGPKDSVLEIGFGGGASLAHLLGGPAGFVAGIEISEAMLRHCRRRFPQELAARQLELSEAGVGAIPYEDERFDRVLTVQTIYFWPDVDAGLGEIRRVLRPGGMLLIATAAKEEMERRAWTEHGFRKFEDSELAGLVERAGFGEVSVERDGVRVFTRGVRR